MIEDPRMRAVAAVGLGFLLLLAAQWAPWAVRDENFSGFGASVESRVASHAWGVVGTGSVEDAGGYSGSTEESRSWFHEDLDDESGIGSLRSAFVFHVLGLTAAAGALALAYLRPRSQLAPSVAGAATVAAVFAAILHWMGLDEFRNGYLDENLAFGYYLVLAGAAAVGAGAFLLLQQRGAPEADASGPA